MLRTLKVSLSWLVVLAAACAVLVLSSPVQAQVSRLFPHDAERGRITFALQARQVLVDGKPERLGPGVQIRDEQGRAPLPGKLAGQTFLTHYVRDASGAIFRIWILTPQEARKPAPNAHRRRGHRDDGFRYLN